MTQHPLPRNSANYTFDTFVVSIGNRHAYEAAREIAADALPSPAAAPCIFYNAAASDGLQQAHPHGIGVTHLLLAAANELQAKGCRILWFSTEDFCRELTQAILSHDAAAFRKQLMTDCDCLILDNIELLAGKTATQEEAVQIMEELAAAGKRTLVGCSGDLYALPCFLDRLQESFPSRQLIAVTPLDEEGKLELINHYCRELGLELTEDEKRRMTSDDARVMRGNLVTWKARRELMR